MNYFAYHFLKPFYDKSSQKKSRQRPLFYVGRDDVHDLLKYILSRVTYSLYPSVTMLITLDKS
jgi:hypothetical protein